MTGNIKKYLLALALIAMPAGAYAQRGRDQAPHPRVTVLKDVNVVDVIGGKVLSRRDIILSDGVIQEITKGYKPAEGDIIEDYKGKFAVPGIIDAHMHLANDPEQSRENRLSELEYLLAHGITSVRDAAGDARILTELKRGVALGQIIGPDIYYAAFIAGPPYYEGNDRENSMVAGYGQQWAPWLQCLSPDDNLDHVMIYAKGCGATGIKIYGGFDKDLTSRLVSAANAHGLEAWGHATLFPAKASEVAEAGVKVISHAYMLEWEEVPNELDASMFKNYELYQRTMTHRNIPLGRFIAAMKEHGSIFDPTLYLCMENSMDWSADAVAELHRNGVKICAGTDWITDTGRDMPFIYDEIELYVNKCGFKPIDAIRSATIIAAETFGGESFTGSINKGKHADIVILDADPTKDIGNLKKINTVYKKGVKYQPR